MYRIMNGRDNLYRNNEDSLWTTCTPNIKLSTKNLRCFYTTTATEKDVTSLIPRDNLIIMYIIMYCMSNYEYIEELIDRGKHDILKSDEQT